MIRLTSDPTAKASAKLDYCQERAKEAADAGGDEPNFVKSCYRHPDVKESIVRETSGKCAYCESKMRHVHWGDVEHIYPQSHFPERKLDYDNLTLSCAICNNRKGSYYDEQNPIIDPYLDRPEDHLVGLGPLVWHRNGSSSGERTIDLLDLNRNDLRERRLERIQQLSSLAKRYKEEPDGPLKEILEDQLRQEKASSAEYALTARAFLLAAHDMD